MAEYRMPAAPSLETLQRAHDLIVSSYLSLHGIVDSIFRGVDAEGFESIDGRYLAKMAVFAKQCDDENYDHWALMPWFRRAQDDRPQTVNGDEPASVHDVAFGAVSGWEYGITSLDAGNSAPLLAMMNLSDELHLDIEIVQEKLQREHALATAIFERCLASGLFQIEPTEVASTSNNGTNKSTNTNKKKKTEILSARDIDVRDLWEKLKNDDRPRAEIAREFTRETTGTDPKAKSLLAEINRRARNGKLG